MLIVKKFGGTSVANAERIFNVARRCVEEYQKGNQVVVVLSAMGDTTDDLLDLAATISKKPSKRELDMLMSTGEQVSVSLCAMAIQELGVPAVSLNAFQVPMHTSRAYGNARLKKINTNRIMSELENKKIVLVTGFQGVNRYDDVTTLGRGGSDTTAVALAAVLHADACEIYTDVDGVYTCDPRIVPEAKKLDEITYDDMLDLATLGAQVLHNRSVGMAKKYGVELVVRSSLSDAPGTIVREELKVERKLLSGVAVDKSPARISLIGLHDIPGIAFKVFNLLGSQGISVDIILQSVGRDGTKDISFTVDRKNLDEALKVLEANMSKLTAERIEHEENVAKVSVVGAGMMTDPGVAAKMFEALYNADINIKMIATSEIRITVLIDEASADAAARAVHNAFLPED
ncbi:MAG: aspartate kinase [Lachnospiraceae bacterium]|nr:aspartate kinase [Lachnospiraceae bacterium]